MCLTEIAQQQRAEKGTVPARSRSASHAWVAATTKARPMPTQAELVMYLYYYLGPASRSSGKRKPSCLQPQTGAAVFYSRFRPTTEAQQG